MKYFKESEFTCRCGCGLNNMHPEFLKKLDIARDTSGCVYNLNSACRCEKHNKNCGGSPTSSHLIGRAVDIRYSSALQLVMIVYGLTKAGFNRIGINDSKKFVHVDDDPHKPNAIFTY